MQIPLKVGRKYAEAVKAALAPYCYDGKIEVAGSIRRGRPVVNDIDIVCMPKDVQGLRVRAAQKARPIAGGDCNFSVEMPNGIQVDLFFSWPHHQDLMGDVHTNWGAVLLTRTGRKEHNIFLVQHAKAKGLAYHPQKGVLDGKGNLLASETEHDIFKALGLAYVGPERRER